MIGHAPCQDGKLPLTMPGVHQNIRHFRKKMFYDSRPNKGSTLVPFRKIVSYTRLLVSLTKHFISLSCSVRKVTSKPDPHIALPAYTWLGRAKTGTSYPRRSIPCLPLFTYIRSGRSATRTKSHVTANASRWYIAYFTVRHSLSRCACVYYRPRWLALEARKCRFV